MTRDDKLDALTNLMWGQFSWVDLRLMLDAHVYSDDDIEELDNSIETEAARVMELAEQLSVPYKKCKDGSYEAALHSNGYYDAKKILEALYNGQTDEKD